MKAFLIVACVVVCAAALNDFNVREKRQANNYYQRYQEERQAYADQQQQMYADQQRQMYDEQQAAYQEYEQQQRDDAERRFEEQMDARYGRGKREAVDNNTETVSTQENHDSLVRQKRQANNYYQRYQEERQAYADQQQQMYADQQRQMYDEQQAAYQEYEQQQRDDAERRFEEQMDARYGRGKREAVDNTTETVSTQVNQDSLVRQKRQAYGYNVGYGGYGVPADPAMVYAQRFGSGYSQSYGGYGGGYYPNSPYDGRIYGR